MQTHQYFHLSSRVTLSVKLNGIQPRVYFNKEEIFFDHYTLTIFCNHWSSIKLHQNVDYDLCYYPSEMKVITNTGESIDIYCAPDKHVHLNASECEKLDVLLPDISKCVKHLFENNHLCSTTFNAICNEMYALFPSMQHYFKNFKHFYKWYMIYGKRPDISASRYEPRNVFWSCLIQYPFVEFLNATKFNYRLSYYLTEDFKNDMSDQVYRC